MRAVAHALDADEVVVGANALEHGAAVAIVIDLEASERAVGQVGEKLAGPRRTGPWLLSRYLSMPRLRTEAASLSLA
jgi:hypothetical protein